MRSRRMKRGRFGFYVAFNSLGHIATRLETRKVCTLAIGPKGSLSFKVTKDRHQQHRTFV